MNPLNLVRGPVDALARSFSDSNTFSHVIKLTQIAMEAVAPKISFPVYDVFDKFNGLVSATNWVTFTNRSFTQLTAPIVDPIMWVLDEGFNVSMWLSNMRAALDYLQKMDMLDLGTLATKMGSIPVFGAVVDLILLPGIKNTFLILAFTLDMGKQVLEIGRHGVNGNGVLLWIAATKLTGDVAKIAIIVLTTSAIVRALSSGCSLVSFLADSYYRRPLGQ